MKKYAYKSILLISTIACLSIPSSTIQASDLVSIDIQQTVSKQDNILFEGEKELQELRDELKKEDVSKKDRDVLIKKLENGEPWDSMKSKYKDLKPQIKSKNYSKTIYPDGSYSIISIEESGPEILEKGVLWFLYPMI